MSKSHSVNEISDVCVCVCVCERERKRWIYILLLRFIKCLFTPVALVMSVISGCIIPHLTVKSRHSDPLPAMLPSAHTAWSTTLPCSDDRRRTKCGTAPGHREWNGIEPVY